MVAAYNEPPYKYFHVASGTTTTAGGTTIKANTVTTGASAPGVNTVVAPGVLHSITFNTTGATVAPITVYDGYSYTGAGGPLPEGNVIAVITPVLTTDPFTLIFDIGYSVGLLFVQTAASTMDYTFSYS